MSRKGKKDFAYHLSRFLSVYLPDQRNVSENTVLSYKDTFKLILLFAKDEKTLLSNQLSISDLTRPFFEEFIQWLEILPEMQCFYLQPAIRSNSRLFYLPSIRDAGNCGTVSGSVGD